MKHPKALLLLHSYSSHMPFRDCGTLSNPRRGLLDTSRHHISYRGPAWGMNVGTPGVSSELRSLSVTFRCRLLMTSVVYCWSH